MQTGNDHGINSAVPGSQICHCEGASRPWQSREGSHDFADSLPGIRLSSARLPRRFAPRNDKSEAFAILTVACTDCKCAAGPGCPLPYNGGCDQRDCLPEIAPQGHFLALRAQGATSPFGLPAMTNLGALRRRMCAAVIVNLQGAQGAPLQAALEIRAKNAPIRSDGGACI